MSPLEFASNTNDYITDYIKFADAKAGAVLTFITAIGAVVAATTDKVLLAARTASSLAFAVACVIASTILVSSLLSLWSAAVAISPRIPSAHKSLHSFVDLSKMSLTDAIQQISALSASDVAEEFIKHNVVLSGIARRNSKQLPLRCFG